LNPDRTRQIYQGLFLKETGWHAVPACNEYDNRFFNSDAHTTGRHASLHPPKPSLHLPGWLSLRLIAGRRQLQVIPGENSYSIDFGD
jgi:hypothetical protein